MATGNLQKRRLRSSQTKVAFKFSNKATCDDSFGHRSCASHLTCGNARRQSRWLRFTSPNRRQRGKSALLASVSGDYAPQSLAVFVPGTKNETASLRFRNSLRICPRVCPKRLREDTRRDSAARWTKPTTKLDPIGMAPRQTSMKE